MYNPRYLQYNLICSCILLAITIGYRLAGAILLKTNLPLHCSFIYKIPCFIIIDHIVANLTAGNKPFIFKGMQNSAVNIEYNGLKTEGNQTYLLTEFKGEKEIKCFQI